MNRNQDLWLIGLTLFILLTLGCSASNMTRVIRKDQTTFTSSTNYSGDTGNNRGHVAGSNTEIAPSFTYAAWDDNGKICILAKFEAVFTISYEAKAGRQQLIAKLPRDVTVKGRCMSLLDDKPILDISWRGGFTLRTVFGKHESTNSWGVFGMDLVYNTKDSAFTESVDGREMIARSDEDSLKQFETLLGKSYYCPSPSIINMYTRDGERTAILRLSTVQLQAYQVVKGKFSPMSRCGLVGFGSGVIAPFYLMGYHEDDSASMIVGVITIFVSVATVAGYAVYRAWFFKKVDYDTMI